tara:strand:- start:813 stop:983 length:171 start_codon:yes stop_codon:yes gene_type:complete
MEEIGLIIVGIVIGIIICHIIDFHTSNKNKSVDKFIEMRNKEMRYKYPITPYKKNK